jgi:arylsulfatase
MPKHQILIFVANRRNLHFGSLLVALLIVMAVAFASMRAHAQDILPRPERPMNQFVGRTIADSQIPQWPATPQAPKGAPNVLLILTDDVGFGASSTFGGPIPTPTLDALAKSGLRYNEFHTTSMCSPTRAALLTGRNHHDVGTGHITENSNVFDGYTNIIPRSAATIAEILRLNGYATALFGKYHNVPAWETSQAGPFDHWPTHMGFDKFYGFVAAATNQWAPAVYDGTTPVEPPHDDPTYHLEHDLADRAIQWIHQEKSLTPDRPFFIHYATSAAHAPHHAPKEWIAKFKGQFDQGWDKVREETLARQKKLGVVPANTRLTPRPAEIPAWDSLTPQQKTIYAHMMEVYAAFLAYSDSQIGRVIDALRDMGQLDNTLIIFIEGDNGSSPEGGLSGSANEMYYVNGLEASLDDIGKHLDDLGGPNAYNQFPVGWAHAMDTPFQYFKYTASHFGGTRNGMVMSWPARIKDKGGLRSQFHHVIDIAPTILDVTGLHMPAIVDGVEQKPMAGVSMAYTFDNPKAPSTRITQYFEQYGNRAIYHDGWVAAAGPTVLPWRMRLDQKKTLEDFKWQLYHITDDYSEAVDLADKEPAKVQQLADLFWAEAAKYHALPLSVGMERNSGPPHPTISSGRTSYTYYPGMKRLNQANAPRLLNCSFSIQADVDIPEPDAHGVMIAGGGRFSGFSFYLLDGKLVFYYNYMNEHRYPIVSDTKVPSGKHVLGVDFKYDGGGFGKGGLATLTLDGKPIGSGRVEKTMPNMMFFSDGLDIGMDTLTPVSNAYQVPFAFTGKLDKVMVTIK